MRGYQEQVLQSATGIGSAVSGNEYKKANEPIRDPTPLEQQMNNLRDALSSFGDMCAKLESAVDRVCGPSPFPRSRGRPPRRRKRAIPRQRAA